MFDNGFDPGFVFRHPTFLVTYIIAIPAWLIAFAAQCASEARYTADSTDVDGASTTGRAPVCGVLWFSIWIQLAIIVHLFLACATDGLAVHRFQLAVVIAIAVVFGVFGTEFIFDSEGSLIAVGVGWLLSCIVDLVWLLYLTSEEDTLFYNILTMGGTGGLSGPSGGRRSKLAHPESNYNASPAPMRSGTSVGYNNRANSAADGGYGGGAIGGGGQGLARGISSQDLGATSGYPMGGYASGGVETTPQKYGAGAHGSQGDEAAKVQKAKANYAYQASPEDPNEVSFAKNDILDVIDATGKWFQVRTPSGQVGIAPSNYLTLI
ncbi:Transmembrane osmosensor [Cryptotrichosporon argae]